MRASSIRIGLPIEKIVQLPLTSHNPTISSSIRTGMRIQKILNFPSLPKVTYVPDQFQSDFEVRKF